MMMDKSHFKPPLVLMLRDRGVLLVAIALLCSASIAETPNGSEIFAKLCSTPVAAVRNARPASGRFPLVLYAGGLGSRADANVELGEYLASHGYITATVAQLGPSAEEPTLETTAGEAGVH